MTGDATHDRASVRDAIKRTGGRHPVAMCVAVFLGCAIDVIVFFGIRGDFLGF